MKTTWCAWVLAGTLMWGAAGCGDDGDDGPIEGSPDCDPIHTASCAMPWPSNLYLEDDPARETGATLSFGDTTLPANDNGVHVDPAPYRMLDGYAVGSPVVVSFPHVDIADMPAERDLGPSVEPDSPTVWLELDDAGQVVRRVPHFAELDTHAAHSPEDQVLFLRPAVILEEATRYVIAFRDLHDTSGEPIAPDEAFVRLRDGSTEGDPQLEPRQARFDEVFEVLEGEGIDRSELTLAWDFVTASSDALHGTMLRVRDLGIEAFDAHGLVIDQESLEIRVYHDEEPDPDEETEQPPYHPHIAVRLDGTFEVPSFLAEDTVSGYTSQRLHRDADGEVAQNGMRQARFRMIIPHSAVDGTGTPHELMLYGHGLLGSGRQVSGSGIPEISHNHHFISFATDWTGMAEFNETDALQAVNEVSRFVFMAEQLHQGILDFVLMARGMRDHLQGFLDELVETEDLGVSPEDGIVVDPEGLHYSGISQGGIFGATFMAVTPDVPRGHLGVPGNNYNTLLERSVDFDPFAAILKLTYSDRKDETILLNLLGLLWELTEPVSYLRHVTAEPFEGNDPHHILLVSATGDWQVALLTNEIAARSDIDIALMDHYGRDLWGIDETPYPHEGSGLVNYSFGNPWPPPGNLTPDDDIGDPHSWPRRLPEHQDQLVTFLRTGVIEDACGGEHCEFPPNP